MPKLLAAALLTATAFASVAAAEPTKPAQQMASDDCARQHKAGKTCTLNIESEEVDGDRPPVQDISVQLLRFKQAASLIRLRRDFVPEIIKTAEDL